MPTKSIIETRRDQIFPVLETLEIERVRRFGQIRSFSAGAALARVGELGLGLAIILDGQVDCTLRDHSGRREPIVSAGAGAFIGELAQLTGRPALIDAHAHGPVQALIIPPDQLRALLIAEAELGERIMRALILRRVGLIEAGAGGPVIVGRGASGDVLRLEGFLRRNGQPHQTLNPETDPEAKALVERFHVDAGQLPIVLCPGGQLLRNPSEIELARCLGLVGPIDPNRVYDVVIVGAGQQALRPRSTPARKGSPFSYSTVARSAGRPAPRLVSRTTWASRQASPEWPSWHARTIRRRNSGWRWRSPTR